VCSLWIPLDPVDQSVCPEFIAGSHQWGEWWRLEPGDCIAFHFLTVHGAPENLSAHRRRAFSARLLGDDATFAVRGGEMSPPFHGLEKRLNTCKHPFFHHRSFILQVKGGFLVNGLSQQVG